MSITEPDYESVWRDWILALQGLFYAAQGVAFGALVFLPSYLRYLGLDGSRVLSGKSLSSSWPSSPDGFSSHATTMATKNNPQQATAWSETNAVVLPLLFSALQIS